MVQAQTSHDENGAIVELRQGRVRGAQRDGVHSFRGIPYGDTTAGANRFRPPRPPRAWSGIRDALTTGRKAPQWGDKSDLLEWKLWIRDTGEMGEDCLVLNVFTPEVNGSGKRPVMFYIHGGGFSRGSGSTAGLDGSRLAKAQDVVVVTINHRLNIFGHFYLGHLDRDRYADAGNNGLLDIVAALRWVKEHIASFGGDSGNVTIFGQSGGGGKIAALMAMRGAKGLFHRAVIQSAGSMIRIAEPDEAAASANAALAELGLKPNELDKLGDIPMEKILAARHKATALTGDFFRPVIDRKSLFTHPFDPDAPEAARDVPLLIGTCETESAFNLSHDLSMFSLSEDEARKRIQQFLTLDDAGTDRLIAAYHSSHPEETPSETMIRVFSDQMLRRNAIVAAEKRVAQGSAPTYMYLFTWRTPVLGGILKSPHTMCLPLIFGTIDVAAPMMGTGAELQPLMERVMAAWAAFARTGNPAHADLPAWAPYALPQRATMIFDNTCRLENDPNGKDRLALEAAPLYSPVEHHYAGMRAHDPGQKRHAS